MTSTEIKNAIFIVSTIIVIIFAPNENFRLNQDAGEKRDEEREIGKRRSFQKAEGRYQFYE